MIWRRLLPFAAALTALGVAVWATPPTETEGLRAPAADRAAPRAGEPETVVLVHGFGRRPASMAPLGRDLVAAGYHVINVGYDSWNDPVELSKQLRDAVDACCYGFAEQVHFVTHSLGGILVRKYLADHSPGHRGRVVMLSPPNQGSQIVDRVSTMPFLQALLGPTAGDLGTDPESLPNRLGPATFELGIITGDRSLNPFYSWLIPGPDDGKVAVESAALEGAAGLLVVPYSHSFIMNRQTVVSEVIYFLREGRFSAEAMERYGPGS